MSWWDGLSSAQREQVKTWVRTHPGSTPDLLARFLAKPVIGTTPANVVQVPRDQWDAQKRKVLRGIATAAGITKADLADAQLVGQKIVAWVGTLANADREREQATRLPIFWITYSELRENWDDLASDDYTVQDTGSQPIYGVSDCEAISGNNRATGDDIETAQRAIAAGG